MKIAIFTPIKSTITLYFSIFANHSCFEHIGIPLQRLPLALNLLTYRFLRVSLAHSTMVFLHYPLHLNPFTFPSYVGFTVWSSFVLWRSLPISPNSFYRYVYSYSTIICFHPNCFAFSFLCLFKQLPAISDCIICNFFSTCMLYILLIMILLPLYIAHLQTLDFMYF